MTFNRMLIEEWFDQYQFEVDYDIGESGVKFFKLGDLNINLNDVELRYIQHIGSPILRESIASEYEGLFGNNVAVTTGAAESIFAIIGALTTPKDHIIVECPNYPSFWYIPESLGRSMDLFYLKYEESFKPNLERLETMIRPNTKIICLTHPNNPTGSKITEEELNRLIDLVEEHDIFLLMDETYRDISFEPPPPRAAILSSKAISVSTMSKVFGVPGIRIGWTASLDDSVIEGILRVREQTTICNSAISEAIASHLLNDKDQHLLEIRHRVRNNFEILLNWIKDHSELEMITPVGGVTCFPRYKESSRNLCSQLVEKHRTFTVPGYCFNMDNHLRIGFGGETNELINGLKKLELVLKELK